MPEIEESRWALAKARDMLLGGRFRCRSARAGRRLHRLAGTRKSRGCLLPSAHCLLLLLMPPMSPSRLG